VARYGGEEFGILLPDTALKAALIAGERFRAAVENLSFDANGRRVSVTASLGLACTEELGGDLLPPALIECADQALYAAKNSGRNCLFVTTLEGPRACDADIEEEVRTESRAPRHG
jgi:diguanylate cyclase (GGDEF)-like protein